MTHPTERTLEQKYDILNERYSSVVEANIKLQDQLQLMQRTARQQQHIIDRQAQELVEAQKNLQLLGNARQEGQASDHDEIRYLRGLLIEAGINPSRPSRAGRG